MVDFPGNVKNAVNKRIADDTIQQFQIGEFTVSCKELTLKRAILVHESNFTIYESEYRGSVVAVKVVAVEETHQISNYIDAVVDLTSFAALSHDNISSFLGAGYTLNSENKLREVMRPSFCCMSCVDIWFLTTTYPLFTPTPSSDYDSDGALRTWYTAQPSEEVAGLADEDNAGS